MCELCVIKLRDMCIFKNQMEESYTRLGQISKSTSGAKWLLNFKFIYLIIIH